MRIFPGIQPTGLKHLGNYAGGFRQYAVTQEQGEAFFCIVDLHSVSVEHDPDGVIRRMPWSIDGRPMLGVAAARRSPGFIDAPDPGGSQLVHFVGPPRHGVHTVSYYQVLQPGLLPPGFFQDKIVLVGRSLSAAAAIDQPDHFRTPVAVRMPGVSVRPDGSNRAPLYFFTSSASGTPTCRR